MNELLRHVRAGDRVEFAFGKALITGRVNGYRLVPSAVGETQLLYIEGDDNHHYPSIDAVNCRLIGARPSGPTASKPETREIPIDTPAVARRAVSSSRGANAISTVEIAALAHDFLTLLDLASAHNLLPSEFGEQSK